MPALSTLKYQDRLLADDRQFQAWNLTRRGRKSFTATAKITGKAVSNRRYEGNIIAASLRQVKIDMRYVAQHARVVDYTVELVEEEVEINDKKYLMITAQFPNGSHIIGLPANEDTVRGVNGDVLWDEAGATPNSRNIFAAIFPVVTLGYQFWAIGTPKGRKNIFYDVCKGTRSRFFSYHEVTIVDAMRDGLVIIDPETGKPSTLERLKQAFGDDELFRQEYMCEFLDEADAYISWDLINENADPNLDVEQIKAATWIKDLIAEVEKAHQRFKITGQDVPPSDEVLRRIVMGWVLKGEGYSGFDIARHRHRSVIWANEQDDYGRKLLSALVDLSKKDFWIQKHVAAGLMLHPNMRRMCIDATGLGEDLAEYLQTKLGAGRVEAVKFGQTSKEIMATRGRQVLEDHQQVLPVDHDIHNSIHAVRRYPTASGFRFDAEASEESGHADEFWAWVLSLEAASKPARPFDPSALQTVSTGDPWTDAEGRRVYL